MQHLAVVTLAESPDLRAEIQRIEQEAWSERMRHDVVAHRYWSRLFTDFAGYRSCSPTRRISSA